MTRSGQRKVAASDARAYLGKAVQYLEVAQEAAKAERWAPAVGNAVHAGILAADAVAAKELGEVWRGEHGGAVGHVQKAGTDGKAVARDLQRLLGLKTRAEYDPHPGTRQQAEQAVKAAQRVVEHAGLVVSPPSSQS
jgi:hypothetical protein